MTPEKILEKADKNEIEIDIDQLKNEKNPYLRGKRIWRDYIAAPIASRNLWLVVALLSLVTSLASIAGIIYIGSQSKFIPYVIEVDKLGRSQYMGTIPQYDSFRNPKIINVMLNDFISDFRTVSSDREIEAKFLARLYSKLKNNSQAHAKVGLYFTENNEKNNPFIRSQVQTVQVIINSILATTKNTYAVEWKEVTRESGTGKIIDESRYKSYVTIEFIDTQMANFDILINNPLGLYVTDFTLQKLD